MFTDGWIDGRTNGGRTIIRPVLKTGNRTLMDNYFVIQPSKSASPLLWRSRWAKNWNTQFSFDTDPEISQSPSVYAVWIRSYAPNWKCLLLQGNLTRIVYPNTFYLFLYNADWMLN